METALQLGSWIAQFDVTVVTLYFMLFGFALICWKAQQREDFDFARMLMDHNGKESSTRMGTLTCLWLSSATLLMLFTKLDPKDVNQMHIWLFGLYVAIWSGSGMVSKIVDAWTFVRSGGKVLPPLPDTLTNTVETPKDSQQ